MLRPISLVLTVLALNTGCSALKHNVPVDEPKDGPRARIRVVIPSVFNNYAAVRAYPDTACIPKINESPGNGNVVVSQFGFAANLNDQKIGIPDTPVSLDKSHNNAEIYVRANQSITFFYLGPVGRIDMPIERNVRYSSCGFAIALIPQADTDYQIEFDRPREPGAITEHVATGAEANCRHTYRVTQINASPTNTVEQTPVSATRVDACPKKVR